MSRPKAYETEDLNLFYDLISIGILILPIVFAFVLGYHWGQR